MRGFPWHEYHRQILRERYPVEGALPLATLWGISSNTVRREATRLGILSKFQETRQQNKTNLDVGYFKTWSPGMAYHLGYFLADGCLQKAGKGVLELALKCQLRDEVLLERFQHAVGSSHTRTIVKEVLDNVRVNISTTALAEPLWDMGVRPGKSRVGVPNIEPPEDWAHHFVRGYFDGDGGIHITKKGYPQFQILGCASFMDHVSTIMSRGAGVPYHSPAQTTGNRLTKHPIFRVQWHAVDDVRRIGAWLYDDAQSLFLERKKLRFDSIA
jgi:hypothetical protein